MRYATELEYIQSKIEERKDQLQEYLGGGQIKDFNEYHKLCGFIQGLEAVNQLVIDLARRAEDEDE